MASFNSIIVVGHLGMDPDLRVTPTGKSVCTFNVAENIKTKKKNPRTGGFDEVEETQWFRVTLWDSTAELAAKYLAKGKLVYVSGRLVVEKWTDNSGIEHSTLVVKAKEIQFIDNSERRNGGHSSAAAPPVDGPADITDEDIPF